MRTIILHRWLVTGRDGRRRPTRHLMTEADALATDPTAQLIPGTDEVRHAIEQGHACIAGPSVQSGAGAGAVAAHQARAGCGRVDPA
ncbi:hypothetical protein [Pseudaquabacterium pictum]|uniref:Uncharacterized protein n=1 Tax=Pseudaquabacterium pictum TaxID=2315236 RepID=A0A480ARV1_9BURK|nr:hypothetical protein [Rubrivivax pictus]GCL61478.1 hypothetical protein AQPW35_05590 [Rubrivivax pictus]